MFIERESNFRQTSAQLLEGTSLVVAQTVAQTGSKQII